MAERVGGTRGASSLSEVTGEQDSGSGGVGGERERGETAAGHSGSL